MQDSMTVYRCQCCAHCLTLDTVFDEEDVKDYGEYAVTIQSWDCAGGSKPNLWARIQMGLRMLFKGDLHGDHVILKREDMYRLSMDLDKAVMKIDEYNRKEE